MFCDVIHSFTLFGSFYIQNGRDYTLMVKGKVVKLKNMLLKRFLSFKMVAHDIGERNDLTPMWVKYDIIWILYELFSKEEKTENGYLTAAKLDLT